MFSSLRKPAANAEVSIRKARKSTYTDPLRDKSKEYTTEELDDLKAYLSDFYRTIYKRHDECRIICQEHPKTVGHFFDTLVPRHVTFEDFWQRFFYRCDPDNVIKEWDRQAAAQKHHLDQKIQGSMQSAQKLWTSDVGGVKNDSLESQPGSEAKGSGLIDADESRSNMRELPQIVTISNIEMPVSDCSADLVSQSILETVNVSSVVSPDGCEVTITDTERVLETPSKSETNSIVQAANEEQRSFERPDEANGKIGEEVLLVAEQDLRFDPSIAASKSEGARSVSRIENNASLVSDESVMEIEKQVGRPDEATEQAVKDPPALHTDDLPFVPSVPLSNSLSGQHAVDEVDEEGMKEENEYSERPGKVTERGAEDMLVPDLEEDQIHGNTRPMLAQRGEVSTAQYAANALHEDPSLSSNQSGTAISLDTAKSAQLMVEATHSISRHVAYFDNDASPSVLTTGVPEQGKDLVAEAAPSTASSHPEISSTPAFLETVNATSDDVHTETTHTFDSMSALEEVSPTPPTVSSKVISPAKGPFKSTSVSTKVEVSSNSSVTDLEVSGAEVVLAYRNEHPSNLPVPSPVLSPKSERREEVERTRQKKKNVTPLKNVRQELEALRQSSGGTSIKNLKAFWDHNEKAVSSPKIFKVTRSPRTFGKPLEDSLANVDLVVSVGAPDVKFPLPPTIRPLDIGSDSIELRAAKEESQAVASHSDVAIESVTGHLDSVKPIGQTPKVTLEMEEVAQTSEGLVDTTSPKLSAFVEQNTLNTNEKMAASQACVTLSLEKVLNSINHGAMVEDTNVILQAQQEALVGVPHSEVPSKAATDQLDPLKVAAIAVGGTEKVVFQIEEGVEKSLGAIDSPSPKPSAVFEQHALDTIEKNASQNEITLLSEEVLDSIIQEISVADKTVTIQAVDTVPMISKKQLDPLKPATMVIDANDKNMESLKGPQDLSEVDIRVMENSKTKVAKAFCRSLWELLIAACMVVFAGGISFVVWRHQDYLCAPTDMGELVTGYSEAPFWAHSGYKSLMFGLVCHEDRLQSSLQWSLVPARGSDMFTLLVKDRRENTILVKRERLVSGKVTPTHIVVTNRRGKIEYIDAPWAKAVIQIE